MDGWLVLSCLIDSFASVQYPMPLERYNRQKYLEIVRQYSDKKNFYRKVDLLFFFLWKGSGLAESPRFRHIRKHYAQLRRIVEERHGTEDDVRFDCEKRYISQLRLTNLSSRLPTWSREDSTRSASLFSLVEILYRYARCYAVHEVGKCTVRTA